MSIIKTKDGTQIYYKDWGKGKPVVFSHGWPLSADAWESQTMFLADNGFRCIAHDRRGHALLARRLMNREAAKIDAPTIGGQR